MLVLGDIFSYFSFTLTDCKFLEDVSYTRHQKHNRLSRASHRHARFISNTVSFYFLDFTLEFSQLINGIIILTYIQNPSSASSFDVPLLHFQEKSTPEYPRRYLQNIPLISPHIFYGLGPTSSL